MKSVTLPSQMTAQADRDIQAIYTYLLEEAGETVANRMQDAVGHTIDHLCHTPMIGSHCGFTSTASNQVQRIFVSHPFGGWVLFYTPTPTHIRIERVLHGAQNWSPLYP